MVNLDDYLNNLNDLRYFKDYRSSLKLLQKFISMIPVSNLSDLRYLKITVVLLSYYRLSPQLLTVIQNLTNYRHKFRNYAKSSRPVSD